jgi:uncharacterized lipoprotein YmbA
MRAFLLLVALLATACSSGTPPKTYSLVAIPPGGGSGGHALSAPITLAAVHIPPTLDRKELVRRVGQTEVAVDSQERWAGPVADMIREVLSQDLAARLPNGQVIPPDAPPSARMRQIVVTIVEFGMDQGQEIRLAGEWSMLADGAPDAVLRREFALTVAWPAPGGAGQAEAMSRSLSQLADAIVAALSEKGGS